MFFTVETEPKFTKNDNERKQSNKNRKIPHFNTDTINIIVRVTTTFGGGGQDQESWAPPLCKYISLIIRKSLEMSSISICGFNLLFKLWGQVT